MTDIKQLSDSDLQQALGYKSGGDITKIPDADLQSALTPDLSPEMKAAQAGTQGMNPIWNALKKTGNEAIVNPVVQAVNGITPAINGLNKIEGNNYRIPQVQGPDMTQAGLPAKVEGDIAGGVSQGLGATAMGGGNPILGYGALQGVSAFGQDKPVIPATIGGIAQGEIATAAGWLGSKGAQMVAKPLSSAAQNISSDASKWITKYAPNIGTALGMGGAGAAMAPSGQKIEGAATGATFGAMSPMAGPKFVTSGEYNEKYLPEAGENILKVLNPQKNVLDNFKASGNDVDEAAQTIAHNRIILDKSTDGTRLDNKQGMEQLLNRAKSYEPQLQQAMATNKATMPGQGGFDLGSEENPDKNSIRYLAKQALLDHPDFQNGKAYAAGIKEIDNQINSEIAMPGRGQYVNGQTLDTQKSGWWKVRYDQNNQVAKPIGGILGNIAKQKLEAAYPNQPIQQLNAAQGKLLNAYHLLDMTDNQTIKGGRLGNHFTGIAGGIIGNAVGKAIPIPVLGEAIGTGAGIMAGEGFGKYQNDPTRITQNIAKNLDNLRIVNPSGYQEGFSSRKGVVTPDLMNQRNIPTPQDLAISMNPVAGALGYDRVGAYGASRMAQEQPGMTTPVSRPSGMPINQPPNPGALGLGQSGQGMPNERPQVLPNVHDVIPMRGASQSAVNPMNINPKTAAANGPLQPNLRAQSSSFAKAGTPEVLPESQSGSTLGSRPQTPLSGVSDEQLQNIKNIADAEKILRRGKKK